MNGWKTFAFLVVNSIHQSLSRPSIRKRPKQAESQMEAMQKLQVQTPVMAVGWWCWRWFLETEIWAGEVLGTFNNQQKICFINTLIYTGMSMVLSNWVITPI